MRKEVLIIIVVFALLAILGIFVNSRKDKVADIDSTAPSVRQPESYSTAPTPFLDSGQTHYATLDTDHGLIKIQLFTERVPLAANNFAFLAKEGFYDGLTFHRVIDGFMIQGGDPAGDGTGGPGYTFADEDFTGNYERGIVAYANSGPNTNGSQFFIMQQDNLELPKKYVIFGKVVEGMDTVDKIAQAEVQPNTAGELSKPVEPVKIHTATLSLN